MEDCDHEEKEEKLLLHEEDDYPSLCIVHKDSNHLENEYVKYFFIDALFEEPKVTSDHYPK